MKWSPDLRLALESICDILGISYTMPVDYAPHRWMTVYDAALDFIRKFDAYTLFYSAFLSATDKKLYNVYVKSVHRKHNLKQDAKLQIEEVLKTLGQKKMTSQGTERKQRIIQVLFVKRLQTKATVGFYISVLPLLKKYILMFEMKQPLVHKLHDQQRDLFVEILGLFVKPEVISEAATPARLLQLDVKMTENLLKPCGMYLGQTAKEVVLSTRKGDSMITKFLVSVKQAYTHCVEQLQKSMPLNNRLLIALSALDPEVRQTTVALANLQKLPKFVKNVLNSDDLDAFDRQARSYTVDWDLQALIFKGIKSAY